MKPLVCIFAHPDDEAFGPGGSIATFAKERDVYIICVTNGDAGECSIDQISDLATIRRKELLNSASVLGVKEVFFFDYKDGYLSNSLYHEIATKIQAKLEELQPDTLLTYEPQGVSGHIDHITVSMITSFIFRNNSFIKEVLYYCRLVNTEDSNEDYFIYFPPGYKKDAIDKVVDISNVWDLKLQAMYCHKSQQHDIDRILTKQKELPKEEYFLIKSR